MSDRRGIGDAARRTVIFATVSILIEVLLYSTLPPILPMLVDGLGISKGGAGLLSGAHALGLIVSALPVVFLAPRWGSKPTALGGLALHLIAAVLFGIASSFELLLLSRFLAGIASTVLWTGAIAWMVGVNTEARRSELLSLAAAAAAAGTMLGPLLGGLASVWSRAGVFLIVAGGSASLIYAGLRLRGPGPEPEQRWRAVVAAHWTLDILVPQWVVGIPGMLLGAIGVLGPLHLDRLGWSPLAISACYVAAAAVGVPTRPRVGRWADRFGLRRALCVLILLGGVFTIAASLPDTGFLVAGAVVVACIAYGYLWGPSMSYASAAYKRAGVAQITAFAVMNLTTGIGTFVGAAGAGELAHLEGDGAAYAAVAAICAGTSLVLWVHGRSRPRTGRLLLDADAG